MIELVEKVRQWCRDRHLHTSTPEKQYVKFQEEAGELASDLARGRDPTDSLGDILVTLICLGECLGVHLEDALTVAYEEIKDRKGKLVNGVFIKEADLNATNARDGVG